MPNPPRDGNNDPVLVRHPNTETEAEFAERSKETKREAQVFDQMERSDEVVRAAAWTPNTKTTMWAMMAMANGVAGIPGRKAMIWCCGIIPFQIGTGRAPESAMGRKARQHR